MQHSVLNAILVAVPQAIVFVDNAGRSAWANAQAQKLLCLSGEASAIKPEEISRQMRELRLAAQNQEEIEHRWRVAVQSPLSPITDWVWIFDETYSFRALDVASVPTIDNDLQGRLWIFHDISELYRIHKQLESASVHLSKKNDELEQTNGLLRAASEKIERQLAHQQELARLLEEANTAFEYKNTLLEDSNRRLEQVNKRLQELNQEKNEIIGIVAHDLRNPISAIQMISEFLLESSDKPDDVRMFAGQILQSTDRVLSMIRNLLDMNRLEEGLAQFRIVETDILPLIQSGIELHRHTAQAKNIHIVLTTNNSGEVEPDTEIQAIAFIDEQVLLQVLDNLLSNAVKYSLHGKNVFVRVISSTKVVRIEVQDEGPGISEDDMKKLFGKFARLSAQPTGGEHSTGLGLSIVKKMVEAMNGRVWCESEFGKGATFIAEFPSVYP